MQTQEFDIPTPFLPALINGDWEGLSDDDRAALKAFFENETAPGCRLAALSTVGDGEAFFMRGHALEGYGVGASMCETVLFDVTPQRG